MAFCFKCMFKDFSRYFLNCSRCNKNISPKWLDATLSLKRLFHFVQYSNHTARNPVFWIPDGYVSHKDIDIIDHARKNNIMY